MGASTVERRCQNINCRRVFHPRKADVERGWGKFCSKSCKASEQESRTGQYRELQSQQLDTHYDAEDVY